MCLAACTRKHFVSWRPPALHTHSKLLVMVAYHAEHTTHLCIHAHVNAHSQGCIMQETFIRVMTSSYWYIEASKAPVALLQDPAVIWQKGQYKIKKSYSKT